MKRESVPKIAVEGVSAVTFYLEYLVGEHRLLGCFKEKKSGTCFSCPPVFRGKLCVILFGSVGLDWLLCVNLCTENGFWLVSFGIILGGWELYWSFGLGELNIPSLIAKA